MEKSYQEYAAVLSYQGKKYALAFDSIKYFEKLHDIVDDVPLTGNLNDRVIGGVGRRQVGDSSEDILLLDVDRLLDLDCATVEGG